MEGLKPPSRKKSYLPRFNMYTAMLEEGGFLFEFLLTDGTTDIEGHPGGFAVLNDVRQTFAVLVENAVGDPCGIRLSKF